MCHLFGFHLDLLKENSSEGVEQEGYKSEFSMSSPGNFYEYRNYEPNFLY